MGVPITESTSDVQWLTASLAPDLVSESRLHLPLVEDREQFIEQQCASFTTVAHLGCADSPYTDHRLETGTLLHERLLRRNPGVVGFDIDGPALDRLRTTFPSAEFVCTDVSDAVPPEYQHRFDFVVASEVLEHVPNPAAFLSGIRHLIAPNGYVLVTVPSACSPKIALRSLAGVERVHPDHHVYYGPRTLGRALDFAGYRVTSLATYFAQEPSRIGRALNIVLRLAHDYREGPVGEGLIAIAQPTP